MLKTFLFFFIIFLQVKTVTAYRVNVKYTNCRIRYIIIDEKKCNLDRNVVQKYCNCFFGPIEETKKFYKIEGKIPELDPVIKMGMESSAYMDWIYQTIDQFEKKGDINILKRTYKNYPRPKGLEEVIKKVEDADEYEKMSIIDSQYFPMWHDYLFDAIRAELKSSDRDFHWNAFLKKYKIKEVRKECLPEYEE